MVAASNEDGIRRLEIGLNYLRTEVPKDRFDMRDWVQSTQAYVDKQRGDDWHDFNLDDDTPHCGTLACAFGWMAFCPELQVEGLEPRDGGQPRYGIYGGWSAAMEFFGVTQGQALHMFNVIRNEETDRCEEEPNTDLEAACERIEAVIAQLKAAQT